MENIVTCRREIDVTRRPQRDRAGSSIDAKFVREQAVHERYRAHQHLASSSHEIRAIGTFRSRRSPSSRIVNVRSRWRSTFVVKLSVWLFGYVALMRVLPGTRTGWGLVALFFGAVILTATVMTLIADGPRVLVSNRRSSNRSL